LGRLGRFLDTYPRNRNVRARVPLRQVENLGLAGLLICRLRQWHWTLPGPSRGSRPHEPLQPIDKGLHSHGLLANVITGY